MKMGTAVTVARLGRAFPICALLLPGARALSAEASSGKTSLPTPRGGGLVGHWKLDEGNGRRASDSSGNGNHAAFADGAVWSAGRLGTGVSLDNRGAHVEVPNESAFDFSAAESITIAAWIRPTHLAPNDQETIVTKGADNRPRNFLLCLDGAADGRGILTFKYWQAAGAWQSYNASGRSLDNNSWYHVAAVHTFGDAGSAALYVDGALQQGRWAMGRGNGPPVLNDFPVTFGSSVHSWINDVYGGEIDDVRIYRRRLNGQEIRDLYRQSVATPSPPSVAVVATAASARENSGDAAAFTVSRTGNLHAPLVVRYAVTGSATAGADYVALPGSVTIPKGAGSATIAVVPRDDSVQEEAETVELTLTTSTAYTIDKPDATAILYDVEPAPEAVPREPLGYWKLDDRAGKTAVDSSLNRNHGKIEGARWITGRLGGALGFDGRSYLELPNESAFTFRAGQSITIAAWVRATKIKEGQAKVILAKGKDNGSRNYLFNVVGPGGGRGALQFAYTSRSAGGVCSYEAPSPSILAGAWVHAAVTYTFGAASSLKVFVNGIPEPGAWTSGNGNSDPDQTDSPVRFGAEVASEEKEVFDGQIDEVRIYRRALGAAEIRALGAGRPSPAP